MQPEENAAPADQARVEVLEGLLERARAKGFKTGIADEEIQDLDQDEAEELIDQLRRRLGESREP